MMEPSLTKKKNLFIDKQKRILVIAVISVVTLFIGSSYALLTNFDEADDVVNISTGELNMTISNSAVSLSSVYPMTNEEGLSSSNAPFTVTFTNEDENTNLAIGSFEVKILKDTNPQNISTLDYSNINFAVSTDNTTYSTPKSLSETGNIIYTGYNLAKNSSVTLYIKLWINESIGNSALNKAFYGEINVALYQKNAPEGNEIIKYIKNNTSTAPVNDKDAGIKFYEVNSPTNGEGLYLRNGTESTNNPIFYFRGTHNLNNNLLFANFCWKIVRTTETGGTKLIYNGSPTIVDGKPQCTNTTGANTQLAATSAFNTNSNSPAYVGYNISSTVYTYVEASPATGAIFGSSVGSDGKLVDPQNTLDEYHHYTYNSTSEDATEVESTSGKVRYYFYSDSGVDRYFEFDNTKTISDILNEMLNDNTNTKDRPSTIHTVLDTWYTGTGGLDAYEDDYIEDTVWCNDRSIGSLGGFDPNGGNLSGEWTEYGLILSNYLRYRQGNDGFDSDNRNIKNTNVPYLTCSKSVDSYSVANQKLENPVALLTMDEVALAGGLSYPNGNNNYYLYTNNTYWLLSAATFLSVSQLGAVYTPGYHGNYNVTYSYGVRPSISLKSSVTPLSGTGTQTDPLIITAYTVE